MNKTTPTISDHPLIIGKMIERNRIRNAKWILAMHRREKLKAFWYCAGIITGAIVVIWLWQPIKPALERGRPFPWKLEQIPNVPADSIEYPKVQKPSIEIQG